MGGCTSNIGPKILPFPAKSKTLIPKTANSVLGSCVFRKATNGNNIISLRLVILQIDIVWKKFKQEHSECKLDCWHTLFQVLSFEEL